MRKLIITILLGIAVNQTASAQGVREPEGVRTAGGGQSAISNPNRYTCADIKQRIKWLDEIARNPQSGHTQDWIKRERTEAVDLDFRLQCK